MSSPTIGPTDFSKLVDSMKEGMRKYLPESSDKANVVLESSALFQISYASLRNIPYAFLTKEFAVNDLSHMLSSRVTYLEATLMSLISMVHNLFFAILYSWIVVATLGLSWNLNKSCKIHWMHATYGLICTGIGAVGMLFPYYGVGLNGMLLISTMRMFHQCYQKDVSRFESDFVEYVQQMAAEYSYVVYNLTRTNVHASKYLDIYKHSLEHIEERIQSAERMDDLTQLAVDIFRKWPTMGLSQNMESQVSTDLGSPAAQHHYV